MRTYKTIRHAKLKAARRRLRLKRQRWGDKAIIRNRRRRGVKHG